MAKFRLTEPAKIHLKEIGRYTLRLWGKHQRNDYLGALDARFHILAVSPKQGQSRDEIHPDLRSWHEGSHVIFYLVRKQEIQIVGILHEKMDPILHLRIEH